ncbi:MAG: thiamine-phosphate kinase [Nitrospinaceae bacterium]|nr:thiamine-phosphate kinase [Nitrospinaceae bacterium]MBT3434277.1 thiamine-phosphate kinase [Nitrospinaceae bacterium]MBT4093736.1 thiamine-phosphate kinase [Nitrospinaceae bacterium]MBT4430492.1 thiamine-phosphate kinase [Nitrospinaceae bacterium]MBT5367950.1 thiamine-phosphate kinase [Nitrospinaceae bacterium]
MNAKVQETAGGYGEFALIERLRSKLTKSLEGPNVIVGIGDDAAVLDAGDGKCWVVSCDAQVQGTHFPKTGASGFSVGHKGLAVNISDVASMGARPLYALISLGVTDDTSLEFLDEVYEGINAKAEQWGLAVVGGNVTRTEGPFFIDVFITGEVARENLLLRSGARPGDLILVTGNLGDAAAGFYILNHPELKIGYESRTMLTFAHQRPQPRVREAQAISALCKATAMMDISDALAGDVEHICKASEVGAVIWEHELPISTAALDLASIVQVDPKEWALYGGEDYQLLLTAPVSEVPALQEAVRSVGGGSLTPIGEILLPSEGILIKKRSGTEPLEVKSWDHFGKPEEDPKS